MSITYVLAREVNPIEAAMGYGSEAANAVFEAAKNGGAGLEFVVMPTNESKCPNIYGIPVEITETLAEIAEVTGEVWYVVTHEHTGVTNQ